MSRVNENSDVSHVIFTLLIKMSADKEVNMHGMEEETYEQAQVDSEVLLLLVLSSGGALRKWWHPCEDNFYTQICLHLPIPSEEYGKRQVLSCLSSS